MKPFVFEYIIKRLLELFDLAFNLVDDLFVDVLEDK